MPDLVVALVDTTILKHPARQGTTLPPSTNAGGALYANNNIHHVGASNLTLMHSNVVSYNLLNNIIYSLPPSLCLQHYRWYVLWGRGCPSILYSWDGTPPMETHAMQAPSLLPLPNVMALGLPIHRSFFSVGNYISLVLSDNLLH
jgi:hypothetical protein